MDGLIKMITITKAHGWVEKRATAIWMNLISNNLWQRMLKYTIATTICVILAVTPAVFRVFGRAAYLAPITTVFGHPGRRFGQMAEALVLVVFGALLGTAWSSLGIYFSSLVFPYNEPAAYTIKGIFLAVALLFHGFLRSQSPRLFIFVVLLIIVAVVSLTGASEAVSTVLVTTLLYPILSAVGVLLIVNTVIFPEFSSSYLGITTIETLGETVGALRDAGTYFVTIANNLEIPQEDSKETENQLQKTQTSAEKQTDYDHPSKKVKSAFQKFTALLASQTRKEKSQQGTSTKPKTVSLKGLTDKKAALRTKLAGCKVVQQECNFEIAWAVLPPSDLKAVSVTAMKKLVSNTIALIGACESKYALVGSIKHSEQEDKQVIPKSTSDTGNGNGANLSSGKPSSTLSGPNNNRSAKKKFSKDERATKVAPPNPLAKEKEALELIKPHREIESGDSELLKYLLGHITQSLTELQQNIDRSVDVVTASLAYCYDVKKLPSGSFPPSGIRLDEIDIRVDILTDALEKFDKDSARALANAAALHDEIEGAHVDIMPRMEVFLISSFLLNLRQAAFHTLEMLRHSRLIVEKRQERHGRRRMHFPNIKWRKWLISGGEEDGRSLPARGKKEARTGGGNGTKANESDTLGKGSMLDRKNTERISQGSENTSVKKDLGAGNRKVPLKMNKNPRRIRNTLADFLEYLSASEDVTYAFKLTIAAFIVIFPALLTKWNAWFVANRALWAALQLILVTEVAIGTSIWTFIIRAVGTTIGCLWGYAAYEIASGGRIVCVVILVIGVIPSVYVQLGSKYVKAGIVSIVSMCVVALGTLDPSVPGTATENFLRRLIAFLIGGIVALAIEVLIFPVRARDRLVESLAASIQHISEMEACLAHGIESETNVSNIQSLAISKRFDKSRSKAQGALAAAETFLPFCHQEPRLKGSFDGLALIYTEILYVLHAIVDRMDNMLHLRYAYGSGVLEEFNDQVYSYRRNIAGSVTLVLFAVHEGLTTKVPLPQYLPSPRLAQLRLVNRVREIVLDMGAETIVESEDGASLRRLQLDPATVNLVVRKKFLAWNAAASGKAEVIEFLEELVELVKLLVGANEFRSGMLTRPAYQRHLARREQYHEYTQKEKEEDKDGEGEEKQDVQEATFRDEEESEEQKDTMPEPDENNKGTKKRRATISRHQNTQQKSDQGSPLERTRTQNSDTEEGLPKSLQRVRSRRLEEMSLQKSRSLDAEKRQNQ